MSGKAAKIIFSEKQYAILQQIERSTTAPKRLVQRVSVILMAFAGSLNRDIATKVGLARKQVGLWRRRWQQSFETLVAIECRESQAALRRAIEDVLSDAPRAGSPGTFTAEQVTQILAVACEPPEQSRRPIDHWTHRELTDEVILRGIVPSISVAQVGRYLAQAKLQPHRSKYWLTTKEKDPEIFEQQVQIVCQTYLEAPELYFQENTHTVSVDEMPGLQAIERIAKTIPMQAGKPRRIEYEYKRHGTLCLIGNWDVVLGQMIAPTIRATRTEEDFAWHIHNTVQTDAEASWVFVVDNLNVHCSETLVCYVARLEGIDAGSLGKKRQVRDPQISGDQTSVSFRACSSNSVRVCPETHIVAESDRDRVWDCGSTGHASRQLHVTCSHEGTPAGFHRLLQSHVRQAVPLDLHGSSDHRRNRQTPRDVEGKLGK